MASTAEALIRAASGTATTEHGTVRISCSEVFGVEVLPPILVALQKAHPGLHIELSATNEKEDLLRRDADVAIRLAQPTQQGLVAKRVGSVRLGFFGSDDYFVDHPVPHTKKELANHRCIGRDRDDTFAEVLVNLGFQLGREHFVLRTDSDCAQLAAIRAGLGIGVCQVALAKRSSLLRVLPEVTFELPTWVVTHEDLRSTRRVASVFDFFVSQLQQYCQVA